jgi:Ohr subfamily peroxiredoxin
LFDASYSACFIDALKAVARSRKVTLPRDVGIDASVDLSTVGHGDGVKVRLTVSVPGFDRTAAMELIRAAHQMCPYCNAPHGNVEVTLELAKDTRSLSGYIGHW